MNAASIRSPWARLALLAMAGVWAATAWWITIERGFTASLDKRSQHGVLVDGAGAVFMAFVFFSLSTLALLIVLQSMRASRGMCIATAMLNLGLPVLFMVLR